MLSFHFWQGKSRFTTSVRNNVIYLLSRELLKFFLPLSTAEVLKHKQHNGFGSNYVAQHSHTLYSVVSCAWKKTSLHTVHTDCIHGLTQHSCTITSLLSSAPNCVQNFESHLWTDGQIKLFFFYNTGSHSHGKIPTGLMTNTRVKYDFFQTEWWVGYDVNLDIGPQTLLYFLTLPVKSYTLSSSNKP